MTLTFLNDLPLEIQMIIRLLVAYFLSAIIGYEREVSRRPAGLRTHILVGVGSTAFMLVSIYGFTSPGSTSDPARLAAQIITGIGFLGAGTIWHDHSRVTGLTTAASIWITAAIGMMVGVGMLLMAMVVTLLGWVTLRWLKPEGYLRGRRNIKNGQISSPIEDDDRTE